MHEHVLNYGPAPQARADRVAAPRRAVTPGPPTSRATPGLAAADALVLQRSIGNAAVVRLLRSGPRPSGARATSRPPGHEHGHERGDEQQPTTARIVQGAVRTPGRPLADTVRAEMEERLGVTHGGFASVTVHDGAAGVAASRALGARAFTTADHIVGDVSDRHVLAHELAHVAQQSRGPVAGTLVGGVSLSDPGDRFERAAEAQAAAAMAATPSLAAAGGTGEMREPMRPRTHGTTPVQRAVGFEFELGDVETYALRKDGNGEPVKKRLAKGTRIVRGADYDLTADDPPTDAPGRSTGGELSDLEVIIHPLDDRLPENRANLDRILRSVTVFLESLKTGDAVMARSLGKGRGKFVRNACIQPPENDLLEGTLQATAGLDLSALARIRSNQTYRETYGGSGEKDQESHRGESEDTTLAAYYLQSAGSSPHIYEICLKSVYSRRSRWKAAAPGDLAVAAAVLSLLVEIPVNAYTRADARAYPKAATGSLMARTDFARMLEFLPKSVLDGLRSGSTLKKLVLECVNSALYGLGQGQRVRFDSPVFPHEFHTPGVARPQISIGEWLDGFHLPQATDRLTTAGYRKMRGSRAGKEAEALESMGAMGRRTDPRLGHGRPNRPIFEFRTVGKMLVERLPVVALAVWDLICAAHGEPQEGTSGASSSSAVEVPSFFGRFF